tara:strand:+ start:441 stop:566 length:126 start_codon:yes stop_codon:yes gene_type:complete
MVPPVLSLFSLEVLFARGLALLPTKRLLPRVRHGIRVVLER